MMMLSYETLHASEKYIINGQMMKHYWAKADILDIHIVRMDEAPIA